jgi:hypothetical protein
MVAKLVHPLEVMEKDGPAVFVVTLPAGATVEFEPIEDNDIADVLFEGKKYTAMVSEVLNAAHPLEWDKP